MRDRERLGFSEDPVDWPLTLSTHERRPFLPIWPPTLNKTPLSFILVSARRVLLSAHQRSMTLGVNVDVSTL